MQLEPQDLDYIAYSVQGFLFGMISKLILQLIMYLSKAVRILFPGLYSGIFAIYLRYHASNDGTRDTKTILYIAICALYIFSGVVVGLNMATLIANQSGQITTEYRLLFIQPATFGCCDFIAQFILIYRCWIVWGCNIRPVIVPSILTFVYLATWIATIIPTTITVDGSITTTPWGNSLNITSITLSMVVNALVTGLIVFRIFTVFREVKANSVGQTSVNTGQRNLQSVIFIIIESGMALFSIQLALLVVTIVTTEAALKALPFIGAIHAMLNGITPTIILVRVSMGVSFHDKTSLVGVASSFQFAVDHPNSTSETESTIRRGGIEDDIDSGYNKNSKSKFRQLHKY